MFLPVVLPVFKIHLTYRPCTQYTNYTTHNRGLGDGVVSTGVKGDSRVRNFYEAFEISPRLFKFGDDSIVKCSISF